MLGASFGIATYCFAVVVARHRIAEPFWTWRTGLEGRRAGARTRLRQSRLAIVRCVSLDGQWGAVLNERKDWRAPRCSQTMDLVWIARQHPMHRKSRYLPDGQLTSAVLPRAPITGTNTCPAETRFTA
jgi:hypothetical protein